MNAVKTFIKKEMVLCIASLLAVVSMFFTKPSADYFSYIDYRVLVLLFCFMTVISGFRSIGVFDMIIQKLMSYVKNARQLELVLVLSCFFTSMWITNDVALLTFVPFAIVVLQAVDLTENMIFVITMQTIAANLGSMCTPIGNPQNLYLYSLSGGSFMGFVWLMFPFTVVSLVLIVLTSLLVKPKKTKVNEKTEKANLKSDELQKGFDLYKLYAYIILFILCIMTVLHIIDYRLLFVVIMAAVLILDHRLFAQADYMLLITFAAFFILVGNVKNMQGFSDFLKQYVGGREVLVSVFASQIISNVPAAVLLSGFTDNINALIVGTNIGGLGTLIASMASLISYKQYAAVEGSEKGKYMKIFTLWNLIFLIALLITSAFY